MLKILHEDEAILVLNKPAGLVCHPSKQDALSSLVGRARLYLGEGKPVHMVNRIDRETSGIVVVAKSKDAASELGRLFERRMIRKSYVAIVHGTVAATEGLIERPLGKDVTSAVAIKDCVRDDGATAVTRYRLLSTWEASRRSLAAGHLEILRAAEALGIQAAEGFDWEGWSRSIEGSCFSCLAVDPLSGRKHQIRIHLASIGHPIVGDKLYGFDEQYYLDFVLGRLKVDAWKRLMLPFHALHADRIAFEWRGQSWQFGAPEESWLANFHP